MECSHIPYTDILKPSAVAPHCLHSEPSPLYPTRLEVVVKRTTIQINSER